MSTTRNQSAIAELRDQLSLDYADGTHLNTLSANLGMTRPPFGFSDDTWRAIVKVVALQYKQLLTRFHKVLEVILGPRTTQGTTLSEDVPAGSSELPVTATDDIPQVGTLVLDAGQATEETIEYSFLQVGTDKRFFLNGETTFTHTALSHRALEALIADASSGTNTIQIGNSFDFPTEFPYTVVLGRGTASEEIVVITGIAGDVATLQNNLTKDHSGLAPTEIQTSLLLDYATDANYIVVDDARQFPATGYVALRGAVDEIVHYTHVDYTENMIVFSQALTNSFPSGAEVELMCVKETVLTAPVLIQGAGWDIFQITPKLVEVYIPPRLQDVNNLRTASYLHDKYRGPIATTLAGAISAGDSTFAVPDTGIFPEVGVVNVDGEIVPYTKFDSTTLRLVDQTFQSGHLVGAAVALHQPVHAGTEVIQGNHWLLDDVWAGPYIYDIAEQAPSNTVQALAQNLAGPVNLVLTQVPGNTALEVEDASAFATSGFPYVVRIGARTAGQEDTQVLALHLKQETQATIVSVLGNSITVAALSDFPMARGYRVRVGRGTPNEEICYVLSYTSGTGVFMLESALVNPHSPGELIELIADVLTTEPLSKSHSALISFAQRAELWPQQTSAAVETVAPLYSSIALTFGSFFPTENGKITINFGSGKVPTTTKLLSSTPVGATTLPCGDTSKLPTVYPYSVVVAPGSYKQEIVKVANNNTGTNVLTVPSLRHAHPADTKVVFLPGKPEVLDYQERTGSTLVFSPPIMVDYTHRISESVMAYRTDSVPRSDGFDFPLRLPTSVLTRLQTIIELIRAAGVSVAFIDKR